jgi:hypothetical protein
MGADITMWVEVEVLMKVWRESYGVTPDDAIKNVELNLGERTTGNVRYYEEDETDA